MLFVVTALKSEAQAFVDRYRLQKAKCGRFGMFENESIKVIVSGVGVFNAQEATKTLIDVFKPSMNDYIINIGICGADKRHHIGKLLKIGTIVYDDAEYELDCLAPCTITCKEHEVSLHLYEIVDMESFGFYRATNGFCNRTVYKVVSDHFEPQSVTKEGTKKLISHVIDEIVPKGEEHETL